MIHVKTFLLCLFGSIAFGIVHDLVTANICVEYFTIGHVTIIESENPFILALVWGPLATWWVGAMLGIFIVIHNAIGKSLSLPFEVIRSWIAKLLLVMVCTSTLAGIIGFILASTGTIHMIQQFADRVPTEKHLAYLSVGWAHLSSYLVGLIGGIVICVKIWLKRDPLHRSQ